VVDHEIVEIGAADWRDFRTLRLQALADAPEAFGSRYEDWVDAPEERWRARLLSVPCNMIARSGGRPVGMASGVIDGDEVELISMFVAPEARGNGLALELVERVVAWGAAQGRGTFLMVRVGNAPAIASYERAGFVDQGVPPGWPEDEPQERRMVRRPG
jgi:ribosomal protein S18 acetylase RimI-like enzyme